MSGIKRAAATVGRRAGGATVHAIRRVGLRLRRRWWPTRVRPPLYDGTVLDDLLFGVPINIALRGVRLATRWRRRRADRVTVVIANWNTRDVTAVALAAVRRFSPPDTEVIVIDNGSSDGSREWLATRPHGCRVVRLPFNIGHGRALDLGLFLARSEIAVTFDSDAFPYRLGWLAALTAPLRDEGLHAAGLHGRRDRLHPACTAIRLDAWRATGMSFANHAPWLDTGEEPVFLENSWDTGELVSLRLDPHRIRLLPTTETPYGGLTILDAVYHHQGFTTMVMDPEDARDRTTHEPGFGAAVRGLLGQEFPASASRTTEMSEPNSGIGSDRT